MPSYVSLMALICYGEVCSRHPILHLLWRSLVRQPTFVMKKSGQTSCSTFVMEVWSNILHLLWRSGQTSYPTFVMRKSGQTAYTVMEKSGKTSYICYGEIWSDIFVMKSGQTTYICLEKSDQTSTTVKYQILKISLYLIQCEKQYKLQHSGRGYER